MIVYTIHAGGAARFTHTPLLEDNGQSMLTRLASETGGQAYFEGNGTAVSFSPFLEQVGEMLDRHVRRDDHEET